MRRAQSLPPPASVPAPRVSSAPHRQFRPSPSVPHPQRQFRTSASVPAPSGRSLVAYTRRVRSHDWVDRRSLALHDAIAAKIEADPGLVDVARGNLLRWIGQRPSRALLEWLELLDRTPVPEVARLLRSQGERAARLRQSSPFAGILTPQERMAILREYDPRRA